MKKIASAKPLNDDEILKRVKKAKLSFSKLSDSARASAGQNTPEVPQNVPEPIENPEMKNPAISIDEVAQAVSVVENHISNEPKEILHAEAEPEIEFEPSEELAFLNTESRIKKQTNETVSKKVYRGKRKKSFADETQLSFLESKGFIQELLENLED